MTAEEDNALKLLARRIDSKNTNWWSVYNLMGDALDGFTYRCCICQACHSGSANMVEHGIQHLKEKGLLVFV